MSTNDDLASLVSPEFRPSPARWYILALTGFMGMVQSLVWMGWGTVSQSMYFAYPDWNDSDIGLLGNWGEICFLASSLPATWIMETKGARAGGIVCSIFILIGTGIRCLQWLFLDHTDAGFIFKILAHTGAILNGSMGPFVVSLPSVVSSLWFPAHQRTMATGLSWLCLEGGNALGFIIGPLMVSDAPRSHNTTDSVTNMTLINSTLSEVETEELVSKIRLEVMYFMTLHACLAALLTLLVLVYYPSRPGDLPSFSAGERREDFLQGLKSFMTNRSAVLVCIAFSLSQGVAEAYYPVLDLNFAPIGVGEATAGTIGFTASCVASVTCFLISFWVERMKGSYKRILVILLIVAFGFFFWQTLIVIDVIPFSEIQLFISTVAGSAVNFAATPLMLELGSEVAYPVGEGVVSGVMTFFWTLVGIIYLCMFFIKKIGYAWMNWTMVAALITSIPFVMGIKETFNRSEVDNNNDLNYKSESKDDIIQ